jgi:hypothetical protein
VHDKTKSIEDIEIGDIVLSYNEKTGVKEYKKVTKTFSRKAGDFVTIYLSNDNKLRMTSEHPVAINTAGKLEWIASKDLKIGDELIQYNYGALNLRVNNIRREGKSFEEIYGSDAARIKNDISLATRWENEINRKGKTYDEIFGNKSKDIKKHMSFSMKEGYKTGRTSVFKGKTYAEVMGDGKANERIKKMSLVRKGKTYEQLFGEEKAKDLRKKCSNTAKRINLGMQGTMCKFKKMPKTKLEIKLENMLNETCPGKFVYNGHGDIAILESVDGHKIIPDFIHNNGSKKCIEIFDRGCKEVFWNNCDEYKKWRVGQLSDIGYDVLFIDDSEIDNFDLVNEKISSFIYNPNVKIVKVTDIEFENLYEEDVYNLEVEDNNNYFAYGILVHNCRGPLSLSRDEKRVLVDKTLKFFPERANSWIAEMIGVSMQLVESRRSALEGEKSIKKYDKLETRDGREYPRAVKQKQTEDVDVMDIIEGRGKITAPVPQQRVNEDVSDIIARQKEMIRDKPKTLNAPVEKAVQIDMFVDGEGLVATCVSEDGANAVGIKSSDDGYMIYSYDFAKDKFYPSTSIYFDNESFIKFINSLLVAIK